MSNQDMVTDFMAAKKRHGIRGAIASRYNGGYLGSRMAAAVDVSRLAVEAHDRSDHLLGDVLAECFRKIAVEVIG